MTRISGTPKIFIDGEYGTTGLGIRQRLAGLAVEICSVPQEQRHDMAVRLEKMAQVDLVVLCLPDDASRQAVAAIKELGKVSGQRTPRILDASTAFRTNPEWVYGLAELEAEQADRIATASYVANPGCYSSGAIALLHPLVKAGLIPADYPLTINAVSGYSGGGKQMIADYEQGKAPAFQLYGLGLNHKHLPEICLYGGLTREPIFVPSVGNFAQGMIVSIPLHLDGLKGSVEQVRDCLRTHYQSARNILFVEDEAARLYATDQAQTDIMKVRVHANVRQDQLVLTASLDNLGKGASGAAIQNIRLMLGL